MWSVPRGTRSKVGIGYLRTGGKPTLLAEACGGECHEFVAKSHHNLARAYEYYAEH